MCISLGGGGLVNITLLCFFLSKDRRYIPGLIVPRDAWLEGQRVLAAILWVSCTFRELFLFLFICSWPVYIQLHKSSIYSPSVIIVILMQYLLFMVISGFHKTISRLLTILVTFWIGLF